MTEDNYDRVHDLVEILWDKLRNLVDEELKNESPEVEDVVRDCLTDTINFWKFPWSKTE